MGSSRANYIACNLFEVFFNGMKTYNLHIMIVYMELPAGIA